MSTKRNRWAVGGATAVVVIGVGACGSGGGSPEVATETSVAVASTTAVAATTTLPAPDGVTVAETLTTDMPHTIRLLAHGGEYLELSSSDGGIVLSRSADGTTWTPVPTDLAIDGVSLVESTGAELFASAGWGSSDAEPANIAVSTDGGTTWAASSLTVPIPASPYVIAQTSVSALAADEHAALALGTVFLRGDWVAYSAEVLGADHGQVTGEGGDPTNWTVEFEDGFELTVDLAATGMSEVAGAMNTPMLAGWVRAGSTWAPISLPFTSSSPSNLQLADGPAGFVTVSSPTGFQVGPMVFELSPFDRRDDLDDECAARRVHGHRHLVGVVPRRRTARLRPRQRDEARLLARRTRVDGGGRLRRHLARIGRVPLDVPACGRPGRLRRRLLGPDQPRHPRSGP